MKFLLALGGVAALGLAGCVTEPAPSVPKVYGSVKAPPKGDKPSKVKATPVSTEVLRNEPSEPVVN